MRLLLPLVPLGAAVCSVPAHAQPSASSDGFEITKAPQVVTTAPSGYVGRKTTDRETRRGNSAATEGDSAELVLTVGGFVQGCPTGAGIASGSFEYSVTRDDVDVGPNGTRTMHYGVRALAQLEGHVKDDAMLDYIELDAQITRERDGAAPEQRTVRARFRPGEMGQPDMSAMADAVGQSGDLSTAVIMSMGGSIFAEAQLYWNDTQNECVVFRFEPPTKTRTLEANQVVDVQTELLAKNGGSPIAGGKFGANALEGVGRVTPTEGRVEGAPSRFSYTASATPRAGHGFDVAAQTRAGVGKSIWQIRDAGRFEGTFSQTMNGSIGAAAIAAAPGLPPGLGGQLAQGAAQYGVGARMQSEISGNLVWTPAQDSVRAKTFDDVDSTFYEPTDGDLTVQVDSVGESAAGSCTIKGEKTFMIRELPPAARQFLVLEVAADGRYKIMLGMISYFLQLQATQTCRVMRRQMIDSLIVNDAGIVLGQQSGTSTPDGTIEGETRQPIVEGVNTYTGRWSFRRVEPQR